MVPAGHGDCILLQYGTRLQSHWVLVDGGPIHSYPALRQRIQSCTRTLQLLVVTHVDSDHVDGIVRLLQDSSVNLIVRDIWFNGWRQLRPCTGTLGPVAGEYLSALIAKRALRWNAAFGCAAVATTPPSYPVVELEDGLKLTVLSPTRPALDRLSRIWARTVQREGLAPGCTRDAYEHLVSSHRFGRHTVLGGLNIDDLSREAEISDDSTANGSSIALIAEFQGKRVLLAGDSHPSILEQAIRTLLGLNGQPRLTLEAFKLAHHGSKGSITNSLLKLLDCHNYLISTNGDYFGHPDDEAVARVVRHGGPGVQLYFNYRQAASRFWDDSELRKREGFQVIYPSGDNGLKIQLDKSC